MQHASGADAVNDLRARVGELEEEVRQKRELLTPETQYRVELGPVQRRLLATLHAARGAPRSSKWLLETVWPDDPVSGANLRLQIHNLRGILAPTVRIASRRPSLYFIDPDTLPVLDALRVLPWMNLFSPRRAASSGISTST